MMEHTLISSEDETSAEANAYGMIKHNNRLALETKLHTILETKIVHPKRL